MMNLELKMRLTLRFFALVGAKPFHQSTIEEIRARDNAPETPINRLFLGPKPDIPLVEDRTILTRHGDVPARIFAHGGDEIRPILYFMHGGGFAVGNLKTYDHVCRRLAVESGHQVVAVEYSKAPEHKFPIGIEDCYDSLLWIYEHGAEFGGDVTQISVCGDSAGGNFSAVLCQMSRDLGGPKIARQVLLYAALDSSKSYPSEDIYAEAPIISKNDMHYFANHYLASQEDRFDPRCSPLLGNLEGLPPALFINAEYDPLVDQGKAYAAALRAAGVPTVFRLYPRQVHGFMSLAGVSSQATAAYAEVGRFLSEEGA